MFRFVIGLFAGFVLIYVFFWHAKPAIESMVPVEISTLLKHANEFDGRLVTVAGTVISSGAIMGLGGFRLRQGDAELIVLSAQGTPPAGSEIRIAGIFKQALALGRGTEYAVLLQQ